VKDDDYDDDDDEMPLFTNFDSTEKLHNIILEKWPTLLHTCIGGKFSMAPK